MLTRRLLSGFALLALVGTAAVPAPARAQATPTGGFAPLVERLSPAVVTVNAYIPTGQGPRFAPGSALDDIHKGAVGERTSTGSGFVIDASGLVVTNNHVVAEGERFDLVFADGSVAPATLVGRDEATDLAVLRVRAGRPLPALAWANSDAVRIGDWTIAIGNPFGLGGSVSVGVLSGRNRDLNAGQYDEFLQTDAAINRGNSGGPLFNASGGVIGVNTAIVSPTGGSVGVGFAVPSNMARRIVRDLVAYGEVVRGFIGVRATALDALSATRLGLTSVRGARIVAVTPRSPGAAAGLRPDDVVQRFNGTDITDARALTRAVADAPVGKPVSVQIWRDRAARTLTLTPQKLVAGAGNGRTQTAEARTLGLVLAPLSDQTRKTRAIPGAIKGVVVQGVALTGTTGKAVVAGDVLVDVQGRPVQSVADARAALDVEARRRKAVIVRLWRNGKLIYRALPSRG